MLVRFIAVALIGLGVIELSLSWVESFHAPYAHAKRSILCFRPFSLVRGWRF